MKNISLIAAGAVIAPLAGPMAAVQAAEGVPSLVGQWTGVALAVVQGGGRHFAAGELGTTHFTRNRFTYVIEQQEGNAFAGYFHDESMEFREPVIGAINPNGRQGITRDEDGGGTFDLTSADEMNLCYGHSSAESRVAVCYVLKRQK